MRHDYETISHERVGDHVMLLYLDRPQRANAMNTQMGLDLRELFMDLYVDQEDLRCIVVTGRGEKIFCAGGDLKDRNGMTDAQWQHQHAIFEQMVRHMRECPIPIIGAINGAAFGGGCEFALSCDTGQPFSAGDAEAWGLVNRVCPAEELLPQTLETAARIARNAPISVRQAKKSTGIATQIDRSSAYQFELEAYNRMVPTEDRLEGVRAFNEKRTPVFKGR